MSLVQIIKYFTYLSL
uniref:Uncharacterized protein n=1 Tax=Anguilla anguilla TaxID=7936 RepID=A0A0E9V0A5_ANGAN